MNIEEEKHKKGIPIRQSLEDILPYAWSRKPGQFMIRELAQSHILNPLRSDTKVEFIFVDFHQLPANPSFYGNGNV